MNRTIMNFEATVSSNGYNQSGADVYTVRLYMNHHMVKHWDLPLREGYILTQNRAMLDEFVAGKFFEALNGGSW